MNRKELENLTKNSLEHINFCFDNKLLKKRFICEVCMNEKRLVATNSIRDGFVWKCYSRKCSKNTTTIRKDSIFTDFKLPLKTIFFLFYDFAIQTPLNIVQKETKLSNVTITKYFKFCRLLIENYYFCFENNKKIGGNNKIVEIDECCLFRRKYNVGRIQNQIWIFGGIERGENGKSFFEKVNNRNAVTLKEVLLRRVESGTTIISDSWKAYKNLEEMGFQHFKINHSVNFVNPFFPEINTQKIESTWNTLRKLIKKKGTNIRKNHSEYLLEFQFRKENKNVFEALLNIIKKTNNFE